MGKMVRDEKTGAWRCTCHWSREAHGNYCPEHGTPAASVPDPLACAAARIAVLEAEVACLRASLAGQAPKPAAVRPEGCGTHGMDLECEGCGIKLYGRDWPACCPHEAAAVR